MESIAEGQVHDAAGAKQVVSKLMNTLVRAHLEDGRIISGQLWCFDQLKNCILLSGYETRKDEAEVRALGPLIMVPGKHILKLEATKSALETAISAVDAAPEVE